MKLLAQLRTALFWLIILPVVSVSTTTMAQDGVDVNARIAAMWDDIQVSNFSLDLQREYADELLEYYLTSGESDAGLEAGSSAFLMLANVGDLSLLNESIDRLDDSAYLWSRIMLACEPIST